jgi:hypothetical protein
MEKLKIKKVHLRVNFMRLKYFIFFITIFSIGIEYISDTILDHC